VPWSLWDRAQMTGWKSRSSTGAAGVWRGVRSDHAERPATLALVSNRGRVVECGLANRDRSCTSRRATGGDVRHENLGSRTIVSARLIH
jgi:hypothetical protein